MFWRVLAIGAACVLFLHNAGCENMDKVSGFFSVEAETSSTDRLVNAPIEQVSVTTQTTMSSLGYAANTTKQGDEVRISAKNSLGYKFTVILNSVKGKDGEQTRAHIEWEGGRDDQTGFLILSRLQPYAK
jgi:hypothetical protein